MVHISDVEFLVSFFNNRIVREGLAWAIWGQVQGVGQEAGVNTRPLTCQSPRGMASGGQEEPFSRLALAV